MIWFWVCRAMRARSLQCPRAACLSCKGVSKQPNLSCRSPAFCNVSSSSWMVALSSSVRQEMLGLFLELKKLLSLAALLGASVRFCGLRLARPAFRPLTRRLKDSFQRVYTPNVCLPLPGCTIVPLGPDKSPRWTRPASTSAGYTCSGLFSQSFLFLGLKCLAQSSGILN